MPCSLLSNVCIMIITLCVLFDQYVYIVQAGNCFNHRLNDMCYGLKIANANEEQCANSYYSDDLLKALDGLVYADKCHHVKVLPKRCDVDCGLGQECHWIDGEEMCVCSEESCTSSDSLLSKIDQQPVCASNNMTFISQCAMEAWKCNNQQSALYKKYDGLCRKDCQHVECPHDKLCMLVKNTGEPICYPKTFCNPSVDAKPVCGTDGVTYTNICTMRLNADKHGRTPELAHKGRCENRCRSSLCQTNERCVYSKQSRPVCIRCQYPPRFYTHSGECSANIPVCGDGTHLYKNYCSLLRAQCDKNQYINIVQYDVCPNLTRKKVYSK